jgi:DNA-binding NtrC family response regulator
LPESLIESELFGHKKGAFTGAIANTQGLLAAADGGTLFLDEVNSLPLSIQAKLLRFLESGECLSVGDVTPYKVDVRIIAATNTDILRQIDAGEFRRDLYYRLNVVPLELPPLSQRTEDIELLIRHFLTMFSETYAIQSPKFSKAAIKILKAYSWQGNIRELRNLCERLSILLAGRTIEPENLPLEFTRLQTASKTTEFTLPETGVQLDALEANLIYQALNRTQGNRSKSARLLGLSRDTLIYRMQKHGVASH